MPGIDASKNPSPRAVHFVRRERPPVRREEPHETGVRQGGHEPQSCRGRFLGRTRPKRGFQPLAAFIRLVHGARRAESAPGNWPKERLRPVQGRFTERASCRLLCAAAVQA